MFYSQMLRVFKHNIPFYECSFIMHFANRKIPHIVLKYALHLEMENLFIFFTCSYVNKDRCTTKQLSKAIGISVEDNNQQ